MKTFRTICKIGACEPQCGLEIDVENNQIINLRPDKQHPISKGYLCIKAKAVAHYQNDPERLLEPSKQLDGKWQNIDWETANTEIGKKLKHLVDQYGPTSVATYWGNAADSTAMIAANTLCSALGSPNSFNVLSLEYTDRGKVAEKVLGDQTLILQPDADNTEFALLLGTNPLVTQGMTLLQRRPRIGASLKNISRRGGKLVVVDPRETETTRISDQHIMIKPGTDFYLLLGMIKRIVDKNNQDEKFISKYVEGNSKLKQLLTQFSLKKAASKTGIHEQIITTLADEFAAAKSGFVTTRVGVQTSANTTLTEWAVLTLNIITGNVDKKGGVYFNPGAINSTDLIHKFTKRKNSARSRIGSFPQVFGGPPCTVFADDVLSDDRGRIRALIVIAGNPLISFPNTKKVEKALKKLDLLVCIDIYRSDTGSFADYNLPAATIYEKGGLHFLTSSFEPYPYVEWRNKILTPRGSVKSEWDMVRGISRAAGVPFLNNPVINLIDRTLGFFGSAFSEKNLAQYLLLSRFSMKRMTLSKLIKSTHGIKVSEIKWGQFIKSGLLTTDKKIHLVPDNFSQAITVLIHKLDDVSDEFPMLLISGGRRLASFNSWTHNVPFLMDKLKSNYATINSTDARKLGLEDGDFVLVRSQINSLTIMVKLSDKIRKNVIMIHQFWGHNYDSNQSLAKKHPGVNVNLLHDDQVRDQFTGMPVFNGTPCSISKVISSG